MKSRSETYKYQSEFNRGNVQISHSAKGYGFAYFSKKEFKRGEIVMMGIGKKIDHQTPHCSVQISLQTHYMPRAWTGRYWNHSCNPNTHIQTRADGFPDLVATRNIVQEEEITYSYFMTEYEFIKNADETKIKCKCGDKKCKGKILPFSQLDRKDIAMLKKEEVLSEYLYEL